MDNEQQQNTANNQPNDTNKFPPIIKDDKTDEIIKENSKSDSKHKYGSNCENPLYIKDCKKEGWSTAEKISAFAVVLNFIAILITSYSVSRTSKSVDIADSSFKHNIIKDKMAAVQQIKRDYLDSIKTAKVDSIMKDERDSAYKRDIASINLAKKSLNAQIEFLKETQKQFIDKNESYLQVTGFFVDTLQSFKPIFCHFKIENFGNNPAKLLNQVFASNVSFNQMPIKDIEKTGAAQNFTSINTYFGIDRPIEYNDIPLGGDNKYLTQDVYTDIVNSKKNIFVFGKINYENLVTKKKLIYTYLIKCKFKKIGNRIQQEVEYIINENKYYKNHR